MRNFFLISFVFCGSLVCMENEKIELNEILSLQELCIPSVAQRLTELFNSSDDKKKVLHELNQIPFEQLPELTVTAITKKMLEQDNEVISHFPPTITKKIETMSSFKSFWYDRDPKQIIMSRMNGCFDYRDIDTGKLKKLINIDNSVVAIAFNKDRTKVVTGHEDGHIYIWKDLRNLDGQLIAENSEFAPNDESYHLISHVRNKSKPTDIRLSNDDSELTVSYENGIISVWNIVKRSLKHQFFNNDNVRCCCYHPNRSQFAAGYTDGTIHLYKPAVFHELLSTLAAHVGAVESLQYNNAGTQLISTGKDKTIRFWNPQTGNFLFLIKPEVRYAFNVAIKNDDTQLAVGPCNVGEIHLYNLEKKQLAQIVPGQLLLMRYIFSQKETTIHLPEQLMNHYETIPQALRDGIQSNKLITSGTAESMHAIL